MSVLHFFDLFGTLAFAVSGALIALNKKMDLFGVMVLALVTAIGGGTIRDLLLGSAPVFALADPAYIYIALAGALGAFVFCAALFRVNSIILVADAIGLGTFVCIGISRALAAGANVTGAVVLGVITAVAGGIIRDVLAGEIPSVLTRDFYAMACVAGGLIYVILYKYDVPEIGAMLLSAGTVIILRILAIRFKWNFVKRNIRPAGVLGGRAPAAK